MSFEGAFVGASLKRKSKKIRRRGPYFIDSNGNPAPIFKQGRGKPSPSREYLEQQLSLWVWTLEPNWPFFGWILESAESLGSITQAFAALGSRAPSSVVAIAPFLRDTFEETTIAKAAATRKEIEKISIGLSEAEITHNKCHAEFEDAQRVAYWFSEESKNQCKKDLVRRTDQIRSLRIAKSNTKNKLRKYEILRNKYSKPGRVRRNYQPYLAAKIRRIEMDIEADEKVCVDLRSRLSLMTPNNRSQAKQSVERRRLKLSLALEIRSRANTRLAELQTKLLDQEAFLQRKGLLDFIKSGRYALEPRQIAKGLAGLPYVQSRRSAELCAKLQLSVPSSLTYSIFEFLKTSFGEWQGDRSISLEEWFKQAVRQLPKFGGKGEDRRPDILRQRLIKDWHFLKIALVEAQASNPGRIPKHYLIAKRFLTESANPANPLDRLAADDESFDP